MKVLFALLILIGCASVESKQPFVEMPVALKDMNWRWCSEHLDGPESSGKGWCWTGKECRKRFLAKDECRPKRYFCAFSDVDCMKKYDFENKKVMEQEAILMLQ